MLTVLAWKWQTGGTAVYTADHVNRLRAMVARHLALPHQFTCLTDDPAGLDAGIAVVPMFPGAARYVRNLRRLRMFAGDGLVPGERILNLDLDTVILDDLTPLVAALAAAPVAVWWSPAKRSPVGRACNPSFVLFAREALVEPWREFAANPERIFAQAGAEWHPGTSDQCVLSWWLHTRRYVDCVRVSEGEGLYSFRDHVAPRGQVPADARLVGFYDRYDPSDPQLQAAHPWIREHWR